MTPARVQRRATRMRSRRRSPIRRLGPLGGGFRFWVLGSIDTSKGKDPPAPSPGVSCVLVIRDEGEGTLRERTIVEGSLQEGLRTLLVRPLHANVMLLEVCDSVNGPPFREPDVV